MARRANADGEPWHVSGVAMVMMHRRFPATHVRAASAGEVAALSAALASSHKSAHAHDMSSSDPVPGESASSGDVLSSAVRVHCATLQCSPCTRAGVSATAIASCRAAEIDLHRRH
jgi:hypothetical protein